VSFFDESKKTPEPVMLGWSRIDLAFALSCAVLGCLVAVMPHIANRIAYGSWEYISSHDDLLYIAFSKGAYWGGSSLRDPFIDSSRNVPTLYSWLQFTPFAKLAAVVSLPVTLIPLLWRTMGGLLLGPALYFLCRVLLLPLAAARQWAFWCSLVCLSDIGFTKGRFVLDNISALSHLASGSWVTTNPDFAATYRVVSPLVNLPFLLGLAACVSVAQLRGWRWRVAGGLFFGITIALYFFNWTAALVALAGIFAVRLIYSRQNAFRVAAVLVIGGAIGLPQVAYNLR
jgi:hypothetical protein